MSFGKKPRLTNEEIFLKIREFYYAQGADLNIHRMFQDDEERFAKFSSILETPQDGNILVDYSKNKITEALLEKLLELAHERGVEEARDQMFRGDKVNRVENKPVLSNALKKADLQRETHNEKVVVVDKFNVTDECEDLIERMYLFVDAVLSNQWVGCHGKSFSDVVVIGQAASTLASQMATEALTPYRTHLKVHYVNNVDGTAISTVLAEVQRCKTLFVIISENFDDPIVLRNAVTAKNWFLKWASKKDMTKHFVAVSLNKPAAKVFGIHPCNVFRYGEYVTECHSVWSTIGLPLALSVGKEYFAEFLAGAKFMDDHFKTTPINKNIPIILAMIRIWYINFYKAQTHAILPYDQNLRLFPSYVQFLSMKSNGKCYLGLTMREADYDTSPVVWGGFIGENIQVLVQGPALIPCDFIVSALPQYDQDPSMGHHKKRIARFLTLSKLLMKGFPKGDRSSGYSKTQPSEGGEPAHSLLPYDVVQPGEAGEQAMNEEHAEDEAAETNAVAEVSDPPAKSVSPVKKGASPVKSRESSKAASPAKPDDSPKATSPVNAEFPKAASSDKTPERVSPEKPTTKSASPEKAAKSSRVVSPGRTPEPREVTSPTEPGDSTRFSSDTNGPLESALPNKIENGNRPSTSIVVRAFTPFTLGALMGLFEHVSFVQSVVWDIDPFVHPSDSFSTAKASEMLDNIQDPRLRIPTDSSTKGLMNFIKRHSSPADLKDCLLIAYQFLFDPPVFDIMHMGELWNLAALVTMAYLWYHYF